MSLVLTPFRFPFCADLVDEMDFVRIGTANASERAGGTGRTGRGANALEVRLHRISAQSALTLSFQRFLLSIFEFQLAGKALGLQHIRSQSQEDGLIETTAGSKRI
jgi:hypothetical protein